MCGLVKCVDITATGLVSGDVMSALLKRGLRCSPFTNQILKCNAEYETFIPTPNAFCELCR